MGKLWNLTARLKIIFKEMARISAHSFTIKYGIPSGSDVNLFFGSFIAWNIIISEIYGKEIIIWVRHNSWVTIFKFAGTNIDSKKYQNYL